MRTISVDIQNFRCIGSLQLNFDIGGLNTLVGENSVGKSSLFTAISKTIDSVATGSAQFIVEDLRYGKLDSNELKVSCHFELTVQEQKQLLEGMLSSPITGSDRESLYRKFGDYLRDLEIGVTWDEVSKSAYAKIGKMFLQNDWVSNKVLSRGAHNLGAFDDLLKESSNVSNLEARILGLGEGDFLSANAILSRVGQLIRLHFKTFDEFRVRPMASSRSGAIEALKGTEVASVLLNLKNHPELKSRKMYEQICSEFSSFIPSLTIESVDMSPGGGLANVQFIEEGKDWAIPLANVGAGIAELLTFLTNLVAREGNIYVIEEPEMHLHSHAKRRLHTLIKESSERNQIFIITHDEHFIDFDNILGLLRLFLTKDGTQVACLPADTPSNLMGQLSTALKDVDKREAVFARAVLLVEDESQQKFVLGCADKLSQDLDRAGVSVLPVDGHAAFEPYITLVKSLKIPYICLRDKVWGSNSTRPPDIFRALGCELEEYVEQAGLGAMLKESKGKVGTSKQRIAEYVANNIERNQIPPLFSQLITDVMTLAK
ncbi:MAG: AAA family ATPase [Chloroflexi bacterium]|nr:AAA family ATPase [Chloroflexota bacterium]